MAHKLYINGRWVESSSGKTFKSINPANEKTIGYFQAGNKKDVDKAVNAAIKAYKKWRLVPPPKRGEILLEVASILRKRKKKLGKLVTDEMGKQIKEGLGDVQEAIDMFEYMAGEGRRLFGFTTTSELRNKFSMTIRMPLGVVGLITPWNFPFAIPAWKIAPALICGNTVVFKPSSDTPMCAVELVKILEEAGVPKGVVNLVTGSGSEVGVPIVKHPKIAAISFTGSREVGKFVAANAGLKKVGLELGGKNVIIVMDDADLDLAVDGIIWGAFGTTGQRCTATSRVIVHKRVRDELLDKLVRATKKLTIGYGMNHDIGPLINERAVEKVERYISIAKKERCKLVLGGNRIPRKGFFFEPTIFTNVKPKHTIAQEEIFGPVLAIMPVKNFDQAIEYANSVSYGLSSAIYTNDVNKAFIAIRDIEAGLTYVNSSTIGSEVHLPFGGVKDTGNGAREGGILGIEEFSEVKTVYVDYSGKLQKAQID
ncbi:MAG: aldehyde dehydrogenase family protein [Candidatus Diapherotrites archaeon]|nr:aldehyde dehydrogenase family protein [Candidatus Diapherotrites archaeon]